jgi:choice-of-anchor A domain-containing protein
MPFRSLLTTFVLAASGLLPAAAHATALSATQILQQFNTVVLGSATSSSHTDGRTYVGGALSGGDYVQHVNDTAASSYAGLTVAGSASNVKVNGLGAVIAGGLSNSTVNQGSSVIKGGASNSNLNGAAYVEGATSGNNFNGGKLSTPDALMAANLAASTSTNFGSVLGGLSSSLKTLGSTGSSVTFDGNLAIFNAVVNADGLAVFDLTAIDTVLFSKGEFRFNLNGAKTVILNTDVQSASLGANFLGGSAQQYGSQLLWNFYNATDLTINSQWGGSLLATGAYLTNNQNIEGGVYVNGLDQRAEIHLQSFSGTLPSGSNGLAGRPSAAAPEPASIALFAAGLGVMALLGRRRSALSRAR